MFQTCSNSQLLRRVLWISAEQTIGASLKHKNTQPLYIFSRVRVLHLNRLKERTWLHSFDFFYQNVGSSRIPIRILCMYSHLPFALFLKTNGVKSFFFSCKYIFISKDWEKSDRNSWGSYILVGKCALKSFFSFQKCQKILGLLFMILLNLAKQNRN
jgi:hypothetical protein